MLPQLSEKGIMSTISCLNLVLNIFNNLRYTNFLIYIFDSDLNWQMQLMILRVKILVVCVGNFQPLMLIIDFVIPNLSWIYFGMPEIFKTKA